ncbi:MAG: hypothetical protein IKZ98_08275 [Clostridia bacterium]|nr:hypothetical protein [Clostridia bacterium]
MSVKIPKNIILYQEGVRTHMCTSSKKYNEDRSLIQFYNDCVKDLHEIAQKYGAAKKDVIIVPELMIYGKKLADKQKDNLEFQREDFKEQCHRALESCVKMGMAVASKWKHGCENEIEEYIESEEILIRDANELLEEKLPEKLVGVWETDFYKDLCEIWESQMEIPYKYNMPLYYISYAFQAGYQLGISMILDKTNT